MTLYEKKARELEQLDADIVVYASEYVDAQTRLLKAVSEKEAVQLELAKLIKP